MSVAFHLKDQAAALVHPGVTDAVDRERHQAFITGRLAASLPVLAAFPVYLLYAGLRSPWEAAAFAWLVMPLLAVLHVSRTGRIAEAHGLCVLCLLGLAATLTAAGGAGAALAWLVVVPIETLAAGRARFIPAAGLLAVVALVGLTGSTMLLGHHGAPLVRQAVFVLPAIVYAASLALDQHREATRRRLRAVRDAANLRLVAEAAGDLVLRLDPQGSVLSVSAEAQALFAIAPSEFLDRGFFNRVHVGDRPAFLQAVADARDVDDRIVVALKLKRGQTPGAPDTGFADVELRVRRTGEAIAAVVRDVSSIRRHETDLERARAEAERNNLWKDRFLANVSHELRTPLNAIIGFSEMLGNEKLTPRDPAKQREYAGIIHDSGEHLLSVVNTILEISKIESGSLDILPEPFPMRPLVEACCDMMSLRAEKASVTLARDYGAAALDIVADKRACKQILINLLSNAVKFTPAGGTVTVTARIEAASLTLAVRDTGVGIAAGDLPRVGDPFFQASGAYDRAFEGTGLGLSVVRGLVGLHGGAIAIDSTPGEGTLVSVTLPLDCRTALEAPRVIARIDTGRRQMLVKPAKPEPPLSMVKKSA